MKKKNGIGIRGKISQSPFNLYFPVKKFETRAKVPGIGQKFLEKFFEQPSFILYSPDTKSRFETWAKIFLSI